MNRILGIDFGSVRVGVAMSDPLGITAQPLEVIQARRVDPIARIAELVVEHDVERVVVGMPLQLDGEEGLAARAVQRFMAALQAALTIPVDPWDERLTTAQAERSMIAAGARREKRRAQIDRIAAALILQSYLEAKASQ